MQSGVVWSAVREVDGVDLAEFEDLFASTQIKKPKKLHKASTQPAMSCLPKMRAQHLGILLASLPSLDTLSQCILAVDTDVLTTDKLEMLLKAVPSKAEIAKIKRLQSRSASELAKPERFCLLMDAIGIDETQQILQARIYINTFHDTYSSLCDSLTVWNRACLELLHNNAHLLQIFSLVLTLGNHMNSGTNKSGADGFDLEVLSRLKNVKSSKQHNQSTLSLFDYVVQCAMKGNPKRLSETLQNVITAANKGKLNELRVRVVAFIREFKTIVKRKKEELFNADSEDGAVYLNLITLFVESNAPKMDALDDLLHETMSQYSKAVGFYDQTKHKPLNQSNSFMSVFAEFAVDYDRKKMEMETRSTQHRKHNLGEKIPGFENDKPVGVVMDGLATALKAQRRLMHGSRVSE